jgi:hypothetical protein
MDLETINAGQRKKVSRGIKLDKSVMKNVVEIAYELSKIQMQQLSIHL